MMKQELIDEINTEFSYLDLTVGYINELNIQIANNEPIVIQKAAMNQFVLEFYNGIENILKRICKFNSITLPYGDNSHIQLFNLFVSDSNIILPVIFSSPIAEEFKKIRKFRHFIVHGYSFKLEWNYVKDSVVKIDTSYQIVKSNILNYLNTLI